MLKKLLKYDLKFVYKVIIVFYLLGLFFSCLGRGLELFNNSLVFNIIASISKGIAISMLVSAFINAFMRCWVRFKSNLYGDESYLTHTLPVLKKEIYISKILTAIVTIFTTVLLSLTCIFIMYYSKENLNLLKEMLNVVADIYNSTAIKFVFLIFFILFLEMLFLVLVGYVGLILGHKANDGKMVKSIVYGFGLYMLTQGITLILIFLYGLINKDIMDLFFGTTITNLNIVNIIFYVTIVIYIVYIFIYYITGKKQLEKGVDVE